MLQNNITKLVIYTETHKTLEMSIIWKGIILVLLIRKAKNEGLTYFS